MRIQEAKAVSMKVRTLAFLTILVFLACFFSAVKAQEVVCYTATWCGPCQAIKPRLHALQQSGIPVRFVDIDRSPHPGVDRVPTIQVVDGGRVVRQWTGGYPEQELRSLFRRQPQQQQSRWTHGGLVPPPGEKIANAVNHGNTKATRFDVRVFWRNGFGTGTVVRLPSGEIGVLTCAHVVEGTKYARLTNGIGQTCVGEVIAADAQNDLAVLAADNSWTPVEIGDDVPLGTPVQFRGFSESGGLRKFYGKTHKEFTDGCIDAQGGQALNGDSGGGVFSQAKLVGVLNGGANGDTCYRPISYAKRLMQQKCHRPILRRNAAPRLIQPSAGPAPTPAPPQPANLPPRDCGCREEFSKLNETIAIAIKRIELLEALPSECPVAEPGPRGERGLQGIQGPQGERGPQGEQGPAGADADTTELELRITSLEAQLAGLRKSTPVSYDIAHKEN